MSDKELTPGPQSPVVREEGFKMRGCLSLKIRDQMRCAWALAGRFVVWGRQIVKANMRIPSVLRAASVAVLAFSGLNCSSLTAAAAYITGSEHVTGSTFTPKYGDASLLDVGGNPGPFGPFGLNFSYERSFDGMQLVKDLEINFVFDDALGFTDAQKTAYEVAAEANIEGVWNNKFEILDAANGTAFPLSVDLTTTGPFDQTVNVHAGSARGDALNWSQNFIAPIMAHEVGHMLGLFDEYIGGSVDQYPNPTLSDNGLMGAFYTFGLEPVMLPRYYQQYLYYIDTLDLGYDFILEPVTPETVPEPSTALLLLASFVALLSFPMKQRFR